MLKETNFEDKYDRLMKVKTSHLIMPFFRHYSKGLNHITELGVGDESVFGTSCFVNYPKSIVQVDILSQGGNMSTQYICEQNNIKYKFIEGDAKETDLEPTDLLLIDDNHDPGQVAANLKKHSHLVRRIIAIHDSNLPHIQKEIKEFLEASNQKYRRWMILLATPQACGCVFIGRVQYYRHERDSKGKISFTWRVK